MVCQDCNQPQLLALAFYTRRIKCWQILLHIFTVNEAIHILDDFLIFFFLCEQFLSVPWCLSTSVAGTSPPPANWLQTNFSDKRPADTRYWLDDSPASNFATNFQLSICQAGQSLLITGYWSKLEVSNILFKRRKVTECWLHLLI